MGKAARQHSTQGRTDAASKHLGCGAAKNRKLKWRAASPSGHPTTLGGCSMDPPATALCKVR